MFLIDRATKGGEFWFMAQKLCLMASHGFPSQEFAMKVKLLVLVLYDFICISEVFFVLILIMMIGLSTIGALLCTKTRNY